MLVSINRRWSGISDSKLSFSLHSTCLNFVTMLSAESPTASTVLDELPISKNQQKKRKRDEKWEAGREARKAKRKEKNQEKKLQKRIAREAVLNNQSSQIGPPNNAPRHSRSNAVSAGQPKIRRVTQLPITLILDCGFDDLMNEKERKSLGSQLTRCYSDNHKAPYQAHLAISSFGGPLKERFDSVLSGNYRSWKNVHFMDDDFVHVSGQAKSWMAGLPSDKYSTISGLKHFQTTAAEDSPEAETVYLTSDSPNTLTELKPHSTYIIGGLVDRNRHKGICYKRAIERGMKTAKLPIGEHMKMSSRFVLATNHVAEIMLRWLELGDWGKAFLQVIPKRKGGTLLDSSEEGQPSFQGEDVAGEVQDGLTQVAEVQTDHDGKGDDETLILHGDIEDTQIQKGCAGNVEALTGRQEERNGPLEGESGDGMVRPVSEGNQAE